MCNMVFLGAVKIIQYFGEVTVKNSVHNSIMSCLWAHKDFNNNISHLGAKGRVRVKNSYETKLDFCQLELNSVHIGHIKCKKQVPTDPF
jgi:hypothetical protein